MKGISKKSITIALTLGILFGQGMDSNAIENGVYKIPIKIMKKYDEEISMGNAGIEQYGLLKVEGNQENLKVRFKPLSIFGLSGYLSELSMADREVKVISTYDVIDRYNDAEESTDLKVKGKKYPKDMEVSVNIDENEIPIHVYVPVMGELASGDQDARLRLNWPKEISTARVNSYEFDNNEVIEIPKDEVVIEPSVSQNDFEGLDEDKPIKDGRVLPNLEKGEPLKLEDGCYSINVKLYHEREDKLSMGNTAMLQNAEIYVKDGKARLLLGSDKMKLMNIVASLISFQVRDDEEYYHFAKPYAFDLEIPDEAEKRPEVFAFNIDRKDPFLYVKVNPKVKPMGEKPIGARLKIEWNSLNKIQEEQATLYYKMNNGTEKKEFNPNETIIKQSDDIKLIAEPGSFDKDIMFKYNKITGGKKYIDFSKSVGRTTPLSMYSFIIEDNFGTRLTPKKNVTIILPIKNSKDINKVINLNNNTELNYSVKDGCIEISTGESGEVAIVFNKKENIKPNTKPNTKANTKPVKKTVKKSSKKASKKVSKKANKKASEKNSEKTSEKNSGNKKKKSNSLKKESGSKEKKKAASVLTNEKNDFNNGSNGGNRIIESNAEEFIVEENSTKKENPKIIFFCTMFLLATIGSAAYVYIKMWDKFIYEIKISEKLKKKAEKIGGKNE